MFLAILLYSFFGIASASDIQKDINAINQKKQRLDQLKQIDKEIDQMLQELDKMKYDDEYEEAEVINKTANALSYIGISLEKRKLKPD